MTAQAKIRLREVEHGVPFVCIYKGLQVIECYSTPCRAWQAALVLPGRLIPTFLCDCTESLQRKPE
jgi:hypothetical protein